jgi:Pyruvate/2-oxoacid:ferredoxin oxidoreductase gamma subunit
MTKIILIGKGGDGIKYLGKAFGKYLIKLGFEVSLMFSYDAVMRGGDIIAFLIFDKNKIENPVIEEADLAIYLSKSDKNFKSKKNLKFLEKGQTNMSAFEFVTKEIKSKIKK